MQIFVAGHKGLVGSAIGRALNNFPKSNWFGKTRSELDLLNRDKVFEFIKDAKPDAVIIAAAKVGGIKANSDYPVEFLSENLQIQTNLIDACHAANIDKVMFLGSSCIYPKLATQPIKESELLMGPLEPTNEPYALAKITGIKLIQAYRKEYGHKWISVMPTNLYGPNDNFDPESSHVLPALIAKFHKAKLENAPSVTLWGSGSPKREFLHVDDLASACMHLLENYDSPDPINVGTGEDVEIKILAEIIAQITDFKGSVLWDTSLPDGTPRKLLDVSKIHELGWKHSISLNDGIEGTYRWYLENLN